MGNFTVNDPADWMEVVLAQPASVSSGTKYALLLSSANPGQGACYDWRASKNDPYSGGDVESFANGQWSIRTDTGVPMDFAFKTFVDGKAPRVTKRTPTGKQVSSTAKPKVTFSEEMDKTSVEAPETFTLRKKGTSKPIGATVAYVETLSGQHKAILTPARNLRSGVTYTAKITSAATDVAGNPLASPKRWSFTVR